MIPPFAQFHAWLDSLTPGTANAVIGLVAMLVVAAVKKWFPSAFAKLPPSFQALPAALSAAVIGAISASVPNVQGVLQQAFATFLFGGLSAVGTHHVLKENALVPYGRPKPVAPPASPPPA